MRQKQPDWKFAVVCAPGNSNFHWSDVFENKDEAVKYADQSNGRVFGLNPEYEYEVVCNLKVKE